MSSPRPTAGPASPETITPGTSRSSRSRNIGPVAFLFIGMLALELTCRVQDLVVFGTPLLSVYTAQDQLIIRDADGMHGRPHARFRKWIMNGLGMRGPEVPNAKGSMLRVVTAGASETFGLYETPAHEYPRQLEDSLVAHGLPAPQVLNAALPGMSLPTVEEDVRNRLRRLGVDVLVYYPSPVQYLEDEQPVATAPDSVANDQDPPRSRALFPRVLGRIRERIRQALPASLTTWIREREIERAVAAHAADWRFAVLPEDRLAAFDTDLRLLVGSAHHIGARLVLVTHANAFVAAEPADSEWRIAWERFYPRATASTLIAFDSAGAEVTRRVASDSAVALVDLRRITASTTGSLFADYAHFTDRGAAVAAGAVAEAIAHPQPLVTAQ